MNGKVALVTGASRGIGKGVALELAESGATVYATGRTICEQEFAPNRRVITVRCDHTYDSEVEAVFPFRDRLYFACRQGGGGPVVVTSSGDRGDTWNRPGVAVGPTEIDAQVLRVMTMVVNNKGVLGVLTVQRKRSGEPCLAADFSASFDGGATFTAPSRISTSSCGNSPVDVIAGRMTPTYGDYFGLVTTPDGRFRALWPEMREGASVLLTAVIEVDGRVAPPANK